MNIEGHKDFLLVDSFVNAVYATNF